MTINELQELLSRTKRLARVSVQTCIPIILKLGAKKIADIENGMSKSNTDDLMLYIQMCGSEMDIYSQSFHTAHTAEKLREVLTMERVLSGWSVAEFAQRSGVPSQIISAFESGRCNLKIHTFLKLINALGAIIKVDR